MAQGDNRRFLRAFLRNPLNIGAVAPSSRALARAMVAGLELCPGETVLEFGPGTGAFTSEIQRALPPRAQYLGIEREPEFVALLERRYPELRFVTGSAERACQLHAQAGLGPVRAIISGLPFASLPAAVQDGVIQSLNHLIRPGCVFRTFQYVHAYALPSAVRFRRRMGDLFGTHRRRGPILRNVPPAFVLTWTR